MKIQYNVTEFMAYYSRKYDANKVIQCNTYYSYDTEEEAIERIERLLTVHPSYEYSIIKTFSLDR